MQRTKVYEGENPVLLHRRRDWKINNKNSIIADQLVLSPNSMRNGEAHSASASTRPECAIPDDVGPVNHFLASKSDADVEPLMSLTVSLGLLVIVTVVRT